MLWLRRSLGKDGGSGAGGAVEFVVSLWRDGGWMEGVEGEVLLMLWCKCEYMYNYGGAVVMNPTGVLPNIHLYHKVHSMLHMLYSPKLNAAMNTPTQSVKQITI
jgi:hypothetical protein